MKFLTLALVLLPLWSQAGAISDLYNQRSNAEELQRRQAFSKAIDERAFKAVEFVIGGRNLKVKYTIDAQGNKIPEMEMTIDANQLRTYFVRTESGKVCTVALTMVSYDVHTEYVDCK